jgi:hypothetical protein
MFQEIKSLVLLSLALGAFLGYGARTARPGLSEHTPPSRTSADVSDRATRKPASAG